MKLFFQILENMVPWMPKVKKYTILDKKIRSILAMFGGRIRKMTLQKFNIDKFPQTRCQNVAVTDDIVETIDVEMSGSCPNWQKILLTLAFSVPFFTDLHPFHSVQWSYVDLFSLTFA